MIIENAKTFLKLSEQQFKLLVEKSETRALTTAESIELEKLVREIKVLNKFILSGRIIIPRKKRSQRNPETKFAWEVST